MGLAQDSENPLGRGVTGGNHKRGKEEACMTRPQ